MPMPRGGVVWSRVRGGGVGFVAPQKGNKIALGAAILRLARTEATRTSNHAEQRNAG